MKNLGFLIIIMMLCGCASRPPAPISMIPPDSLTVAEVRANPGLFIGSEVRWGGVITQVENKASQTWIEVVSRELGKDGRPKVDGRSDGRFIVNLPGFADPVVYQAGYLLTVVGTIEQQVTRPIGEYDYTFPVVAATGSYMWRIEPEPPFPAYPSPWRYYDYDPWPYYYYRPYPFHPRYR